jgi:hypothetical protein
MRKTAIRSLIELLYACITHKFLGAADEESSSFDPYGRVQEQPPCSEQKKAARRGLAQHMGSYKLKKEITSRILAWAWRPINSSIDQLEAPGIIHTKQIICNNPDLTGYK